MILFTILLCVAVLPASLATSSKNYTTPQIVEFDLVFPKNDTFAPNQELPLLWGLQNAGFAWDMEMEFSWQLERLDHHLTQIEQGTFPRQNYSGGIRNYTSLGTTPADPLFLYYFPEALHNATAGQWKLSWKFGFYLTCSTTNISELIYNYFDHMQPTELIFSVAEGGKLLDLNSLNSSCPDSDFSTVYKVVDYKTVKYYCPILSETPPEASPCTLKFNESLVDEMNAGAATNCSSQDWNIFSNTCQTGGGPGIYQNGLGVLIFAILGVYLFAIVL
ncbi:hypothetical protein BDV18DRAFT_164387 [Aspergillus unguis]